MLTKVNTSFLATTIQQMVLSLQFLSDKLSGDNRIVLVRTLMPITKAIRVIGNRLPGLFYKTDSEHWKMVEEGIVTLRTWEVESSHNYENGLHVTQVCLVHVTQVRLIHVT